MANIRLIRRRIRTIQSTAKITKAMEMIATSKMRRAQETVLSGRPYAEKIRQVLADLALQTEIAIHPLLERREVNRVEVIHITADRGLCGGLNTNMNRTTASFILEQAAPIVLITVGRKGRDFMLRYGREVRAQFTGISDRPVLLDILPISRIVIDDYSNRTVDMVTMRNATENANELVEDLTLMYNKARQEMITTELLDITGGAEALA